MSEWTLEKCVCTKVQQRIRLKILVREPREVSTFFGSTSIVFHQRQTPQKNLFYLSKWNMKWAGTKLIICVPLNLKIKEPFEIPSCRILWLTITCNWIFMCPNLGTLKKCGFLNYPISMYVVFSKSLHLGIWCLAGDSWHSGNISGWNA